MCVYFIANQDLGFDLVIGEAKQDNDFLEVMMSARSNVNNDSKYVTVVGSSSHGPVIGR